MHNNSKDIVKSINNENKIFENNIININFNYNVVENAVVVVKTENITLQNIVLKNNFRNEYIKENVFDKNTKFLIE